MLQSIVSLLLLATASVEVRLTTIDDRVVRGEISSWTEQAIELEQPDGRTVQFKGKQILEVQLAETTRSLAAASEGAIRLTDGSQLASIEITTRGKEAFVSLAALNPQQADVRFPLHAIRSARLMPMSPADSEIATQWNELQNSDAAGDLIVIRKPGAANLNFVEGTLGDVTESVVEFTLDGDTLEVSRAKVFGLVYFRPDSQDGRPAVRAMVTGPGVRLASTSVKWEAGALVARSPLLGDLRLPAGSVSAVDFSIDRLQYLSDLAAVRYQREPAPFSTPVEHLFVDVARDRGFYSPELQLEYPAESLDSEQSGSAGLSELVTFAKGIALRSRTEIVFRVPSGFTKFRATAGIDPQTSSTGEVRFAILADGVELLQRNIRGTDPPIDIECNVEGVREIVLVVDYGNSSGLDSGTGDNLHLGGARFTK